MGKYGRTRGACGRFHFHKTTWGKFPDGTDNIEVGGYTPYNVAGERVLFLASFHNNDVTLSQFQVHNASAIFHHGTRRSVTVLSSGHNGTYCQRRPGSDSQHICANVFKPTFVRPPHAPHHLRLTHATESILPSWKRDWKLENDNSVAFSALERQSIDCIAFPDDGAAKRFARGPCRRAKAKTNEARMTQQGSLRQTKEIPVLF